MTRMLVTIMLLSCLHLSGYAQQDTSALKAVIEPYDPESENSNDHRLASPEALRNSMEYRSEELKVTEFDEKEWKAIVKGVTFDEEPEKEAEKASAPWAGQILKIVSYGVIAAILILVLYYLTRIISLDARIERTKFDPEDIDAPVENIAELDIAQMLDQARREGNYKLAVRLYYLGLLKKLDDKGAIVWKKDKTNRDYLAELLAANIFFNDVRMLTLSYEAVWYGDHDLSPEMFQSLATRFENVYGKINTGATV